MNAVEHPVHPEILPVNLASFRGIPFVVDGKPEYDRHVRRAIGFSELSACHQQSMCAMTGKYMYVMIRTVQPQSHDNFTVSLFHCDAEAHLLVVDSDTIYF